MKFTKKQIDRYSRQIILKKVGVIGQKKLLKSSVLIVGAGGLGSPIAIYLAALGIGDFDNLDEINSKWKLSKRYEPGITEDQRHQLMYQWKRAVARSGKWIEA